MTYAQWVILRIINRLQIKRISVKNARLDWGKFHQNGNKDEEITPAAVNAVTVGAGQTTDVSSCGRSDAPSGTEGTLDLYDGDTKICTLYWNCPWGAKYTDFRIQDGNWDSYTLSAGGPKSNIGWSGALGEIEVEISKKA
ncbi:hypothetical protein BFW01_g1210 [Lasiodiplodia theobromae]|uniref:Asp-hemolysin n=1 Tax=Lasiodiplodia theobromae TaxID=45133 RepID=A0A5N5D7Q9_9PEZI|nr:Asp-hemolysin [Lasiodiplodia theobromae]KAF9630648.1 hypothetical protein BFW01_g1210 [Lasiodiplodia theobromae]